MTAWVGYRTATFESDGRNVSGVAVPFGQVAEVDDGRGPYREAFHRTAFNKALRDRGGKPYPLLMMHPNQPGARTSQVPLGPVNFRAGHDGLEFEGRLSRTREADEALALYNDGILGDVSIGFRGIRERRSRDGEGFYTERMEAHPFELSLAVVGTGLYQGAAVTAVRAQVPAVDTPNRDALERELALLLRP